MTGTGPMTVGELSRRTGTPARALRAWTDMGLVYSAGRSPAGYRLYDESALWCVGVIGELRGLGLTIAEIRARAGVYLSQPGEPVGPHLAALLRRARARADARIADLLQLRERIDQALARDELADGALRDTDPRRGCGA
jgi:MerR family transcriptional regulator, copper efflux regulator